MTATTPVATPPAATRCLRCEKPIKERWEDPSVPICASCALELELFDRESRFA
jgi:hypothetical protein